MANKTSKKQQEARIQQARERQRCENARRERAAAMKKAFTVVICVILVFALGIPTVALAFLAG